MTSKSTKLYSGQVVQCVDSCDARLLVVGDNYTVLSTENTVEQQFIQVLTEEGASGWFYANRFKLVEDNR